MALYLIGIGLEIEDLTVYGCRLVKECRKVYLFASKFHPFVKNELEQSLARELSLIEFEQIEENVPKIIQEIEANGEAQALLMPGNPFCDNFYPYISSSCQKSNTPIKIVHNVSYMNAVGNTGIQLYKFGETLFMHRVQEEDISKSTNVIASNMERQLNTLILFDRFEEDLPSSFAKRLMKHFNEREMTNLASRCLSILKRGKTRIFEYGHLTKVTNAEEERIEALVICHDFDCVEEEYLRDMKRYHDSGGAKGSGPKGSFHIIGLGLGSPEDITLKGRTLIEESGEVFLEGYTSIMFGGEEELEKFLEKDIVVADREVVEQKSDQILGNLEKGVNVSFLVVGDPFGATTHADIALRSLEKCNQIVIANNASIINAIGVSGLKPRRFGGIVSIPFWTNSYKPDSFVDKINANSEMGCHTLCLLDIQVKEQSFENLARGRKVYEKPRYMSVSVAAEQLLESLEKRRREEVPSSLTESTKTISLTRVGTSSEKIALSSLGDLRNLEMGPPLHSLIILGHLDEEEKQCIKFLK